MLASDTHRDCVPERDRYDACECLPASRKFALHQANFRGQSNKAVRNSIPPAKESPVSQRASAVLVTDVTTCQGIGGPETVIDGPARGGKKELSSIMSATELIVSRYAINWGANVNNRVNYKKPNQAAAAI
jgi:hypothetical protein